MANYMATMVFYVDLKDRDEVLKKDIMMIYGDLRKVLKEYGATFDAWYDEKAQCDKITVEFDSFLKMGSFFTSEIIWHKIRWYTITADEARKRSMLNK